LVRVEGEQIVAHGLPAGASELTTHAGELSEGVRLAGVSAENPLVLAIGVGVEGGLLLSHSFKLFDVVSIDLRSALTQDTVVLGNEIVEVGFDQVHVVVGAESLSQSASLGTVPAGQKSPLFNLGVLRVHSCLDLSYFGLSQIIVTRVEAVGVLDAGGRKFIEIFLNVDVLKIIVEVIELKLGHRSVFKLTGTRLINEVNTQVAFLDPLCLNIRAGFPHGLGIELEESSAHSAAPLDSTHPRAVVPLEACTSVRDVVGSTNSEADISLDAD